MKTLAILTLVIGFGTQALATSPEFESKCMLKQKNAASFALAQSQAGSVQKTNVVSFEYGMWTEMPQENSGSDAVTVTLETQAGTRIQKYTVNAKQIGNSADCDIKSVDPIKQ